jgi:hypothetical protein
MWVLQHLLPFCDFWENIQTQHIHSHCLEQRSHPEHPGMWHMS